MSDKPLLSKSSPFAGAIDALLADHQRALEAERNMPPSVVLFTEDDKGDILDATIIDARAYVGNPIGELVLKKSMDLALTDPTSPVTALMFASEAWMVLRPFDAPPTAGALADEPDRIEGIRIELRRREQREVLVYRIDREAKTIMPYEPTPTELSKAMPDGGGPTVH